MSRISTDILVKAVKKVQAMNQAQKVALTDEIFVAQPTLLGTCLVLQRFGVSLEKMEWPLEMLFICFQAMKESGLPWPRISEDELDRQAARYTASIKFSEGLSAVLEARAMEQYLEQHPETVLLAYTTKETKQWLSRVPPADTDNYVMLAVMNLVNCIAYVPLTAAKI